MVSKFVNYKKSLFMIVFSVFSGNVNKTTTITTKSIVRTQNRSTQTRPRLPRTCTNMRRRCLIPSTPCATPPLACMHCHRIRDCHEHAPTCGDVVGSQQHRAPFPHSRECTVPASETATNMHQHAGTLFDPINTVRHSPTRVNALSPRPRLP